MNRNHKIRKNWKKMLVGVSAAAVLFTGIGAVTANVYAAEDTESGITAVAEGSSDSLLMKGPGGRGGFPGGGPGQDGTQPGQMPDGQMPDGETPPEMGEMPGAGENGGFAFGEGPQGSEEGFGSGQMGPMGGNVTYAEEPSKIVTSDVVNTAADLDADEKNAETITMTDADNQVEIESSGTYIITGSCSDGNIVVKKGTTGVVLILRDLDVTSTTGAALSCNKGSEVKIIVDGEVTLTDAENPADEDSEDTEIADAFDGAAIKIKDGANVYLTGSGTLTIDASSCKNGIKVGDADSPSFVIDGELTINITAANDAINSGYDLTILNGTLNISASDDAIHADRILTIGSEDGSGPTINVSSCNEGLEGTIVNLFGGEGGIQASDDGINAANSDYTYADSLTFSVNVTGGTWNVNAGVDGIDSNGDVNFTGGYTTIKSANTAVDAGIDYDGSLYIADGTIDNQSGIAGPDGMGGGMMGGMNGQRRGMNQMPGQTEDQMPEEGKMPELEGEQSEAEGQSPENDGGTASSGAASQSDENAESESEAPAASGFFSRIAEFFRNLFRGRD